MCFKVIAPLLVPLMTLQAQQPVADSSKQPDTKEEIAALKSQLAEQQRQIEQLRQALEKQQAMLEKTEAQATAQAQPKPASLGQVASVKPIAPMPINPAASPMVSQVPEGPGTESPLFFKIGAANFTPLGFMDFFSVTRSTNLGSGVGTNFNAIPYLNSPAGNLTETRFSAQNSRVGLRVDSQVKGFNVLGYLEADFLGNAPNNLFVSSNSDTLRMRLYWVDVKKGAFEFMTGQSWSLMTPNRKGTSPLPSDLFYTQDIDTNYQLGLTWSRQTGARFTWNPNPHVSWAAAVEDQEQYIGGAVVLPASLATPYGSQLSTGSATSTPNVAPDFMTKIAFDGKPAGHQAHFEVAGLLRSFRVFNPTTNQHFSSAGGGGSVNASYELAKNFRLFTNNFASAGGGRYIFGQGPDVVVRPDGSLSLVRAYSTVDGLEVAPNPKWLLYAYYGGAYYGRSVYLNSDGKYVGYGIPGSASANRAIQEVTFGFQNNFWKSPQYGALMLAMQYSYILRAPWDVTDPTAPRDTHMHMGYVNLRYTLP
jgi:hypothetical protein